VESQAKRVKRISHATLASASQQLPAQKLTLKKYYCIFKILGHFFSAKAASKSALAIKLNLLKNVFN